MAIHREHVCSRLLENKEEQVMPKFYVQSGGLEMVLQARDSRCAAIWAAHRTLGQSLPFLCEEPADYAELADLTRLGETIRVSQRGFDRDDAATFNTLDVISEWNQLLVALDRLTANAEGEVRNV
jgi:hypothetical protein